MVIDQSNSPLPIKLKIKKGKEKKVWSLKIHNIYTYPYMPQNIYKIIIHNNNISVKCKKFGHDLDLHKIIHHIQLLRLTQNW